MKRSIPFALAALLSSGCNPLAFNDIEDEAPVIALTAPDGFGVPGFGSRIATWEGSIGGVRVSRLGVTAGVDSPYAVYAFWDQTNELQATGGTLFDDCDEDNDMCPLGSGSDLVGASNWRDDQMCVMVAGSRDGAIRIQCETGGNIFETVRGMAGISLGESMAAFPSGDPLAVIALGAPTDGATGRVYILPDASTSPIGLDLGASGAGSGARLGDRLAAGRIAGGRALIATTATEQDLVVVAAVDRDLSGVVVAEVLLCLDSTEAGFGDAIWLGDVIEDGTPELFVGGHGRVEMYSRLGSLAAGTGCMGGAAPPADRTFTCPSSADVPCDGMSNFGAAVTTGDFDGDGDGDVLIGAPNVTVDGKMNAGAAFIFPGADPNPAGAATLVVSDPKNNEVLGSEVAAVTSLIGRPGERDEPVVAAPGNDVVYVFLCSGLGPRDAPMGRDRCLSGN